MRGLQLSKNQRKINKKPSLLALARLYCSPDIECMQPSDIEEIFLNGNHFHATSSVRKLEHSNAFLISGF